MDGAPVHDINQTDSANIHVHGLSASKMSSQSIPMKKDTMANQVYKFVRPRNRQ